LSGTIKDESSPCTGLKYSVTPIAGATSYEWTVPQGWQIVSGAGTTTIVVKANSESGTVSVSAENASCKSAPITANVEAKAANIDLDIPNAFSPNGDDMNEIWVVKNLENYPDNDLTIINRWGNEVYKQKSYRNTWNGSSLSAGTYYYILRVKLCNNEEKTLKGFIMIATE
jgi:large repetitive protein